MDDDEQEDEERPGEKTRERDDELARETSRVSRRLTRLGFQNATRMRSSMGSGQSCKLANRPGENSVYGLPAG